MEIQLLLAVALRATIIYAFLLVVVRVLGKRQLGIHSAFDLIVAVLLADLASEAVFGNVNLIHSLFAVGIVAGWHLAGRVLGFRHPRVQHWLAVEPTVVIRDGEIQTQALRSERVSEAELWSLLRHHGVENLAEVKLGLLEPTGALTIVRQEWAQHARKGDLLPGLQRGGV